ncbi:MAG: hypothetical protein H6797_01475 [Candidatus Nomurabacteria bacterium]|nr:MAG: hypothetical protein H6797_01475 [Candidatus Nomurabacteria bacterium]
MVPHVGLEAYLVERYMAFLRIVGNVSEAITTVQIRMDERPRAAKSLMKRITRRNK